MNGNILVRIALEFLLIVCEDRYTTLGDHLKAFRYYLTVKIGEYVERAIPTLIHQASTPIRLAPEFEEGLRMLRREVESQGVSR